jgi:hypothetical protein
VGAELAERQDVHAVDVAQAGQEGAESVDGRRVVGPTGDEDVADPHGDGEPVEAGGEGQGGGEDAAGQFPVGGDVEGLDVEQHQVGVGEEFVGGAGAEEAGGVEGGVQTGRLAAAQHRAGEGGLEQRLAAGDRHSSSGCCDERPVLVDLRHHLVDGGLPSVPHVPGVGVGAVQAAQRAAADEQHEPGPGAVHSRGQVPEADPARHLFDRRVHSAPWKCG